MPTRFRKNRRLRGSRTLGWGRVGQHRKSGSKGGKGKAGLHKHKWTWTVKYAKDHYKKDDFKPPNRKIIKKWINLSELEDVYYRLYGGKKEKGEINLVELGYDKLLGRGNVKRAYKVIVRSYSKGAKEKIEKAGGEILIKEVT
ncbi:MAG: uL15 family ribosomal protein [Nitrososphaerales archaeon]